MIKINIDDYIAFTNKLIDANKLQRTFHIVEFVEGRCLAIDGSGDDALVNMRRAIEACKAWGRPIFGFMADNNDTNKLLSWCGGDKAFITKAFAKLMTESYDFSKIILQAAEMSSKILSAAERDTNAS